MRLAIAALVGCCIFGAPTWAQDNTLAVYLDSGKIESPRAKDFLRLEASYILNQAGIRIEWREIRDAAEQESFPLLIVAGFKGACSTNFDGNASPKPRLVKPLASTPVQGDRIMPFTTVDCDALNNLAAAPMAADPKGRRDFLYGRALGRVLAHEIYHIVTQSKDHDEKGVAKSHFKAQEILAESFTFHEPTLAMLRSRPAPPLDTESSVDQTDAR